jgi:type IV secretory pathway TraG/TraD family ATPase VirD4
MAITRESKLGNFVRGFDVIVHNSRMVLTVFLLWFLVAIGVNIASVYNQLPEGYLSFFMDVKSAERKAKYSPNAIVELTFNEQKLTLKAIDLASDEVAKKYINDKFYEAVISGLPIGMTISLVMFIIGAYISIKHGKAAAEDEILKGGQLVDEEQTLNLQYDKSPVFKVGKVAMPEGFEVQHTLMVGAPGSGKSQVLLPILEEIRNLGDVAVVYDPADLIQKFYDPAIDTIFNPLDQRSVVWDPLSEIETEQDADEWAAAIAKPKTGGEGGSSESSEFFIDGAKTVLSEMLKLTVRNGSSFETMIDRFETVDNETIANILAGTPAAKYTDNPKTWGDISATLANYLRSLRLLKNTAQGDWTPGKGLDHHIKNGGVLWLPVNGKQRDLMGPLFTAVFERIANHVLSLTPDSKRRIWLILDEFPSLPKMESVPKLLAEGRKFGVAGFIGVQNYAQIQQTYGKTGAQSVAGLCSTFISMRAADSDTADWCSKMLGDQLIHEVSESISAGSGENKDSVSIRDQRQVRKLVIAGELLNLPNLTGYVRMPAVAVAKFKQEYRNFADVAQKFEPIKVKLLRSNMMAAPLAVPTIVNDEKPVTAPNISTTQAQKQDEEESFF